MNEQSRDDSSGSFPVRTIRRPAMWQVPLLSFAAGGVAIAAWEAGRPAVLDYAFFDELIDVQHMISTRYVEEPDMEKLRQGAIKGMVEALDDQYSVYVSKQEREDFDKDLTGEYVGIGAQVNMPVSRDALNIVSPLEDSPAYRAGLQPEDKVLTINGEPTKGKDVEECVDLLMGEPGTPVTLTIQREGKSFDITITREKIKTRSVKGVYRDPTKPDQWNHIIDKGRRIAYIRLTQFTPQCSLEVEQALRSVRAHEPGAIGGLVLDLRDNPGGVLRDAEQIADLFLKDGVIVSTRGRAIPEEVTRAKSSGTFPEFPIVVLIDGESASASEVLAGALVENNRALLVGTRTFGKGSVQGVLLPQSGDGSELKLTQQAYYLPSGRNITRKDDSPTWGVDPSPGYFVPMTDEQSTESFLVRRRLDIINRGGSNPNATGEAAKAEQPQPNWDDVVWILDTFKDPQLTAAVQAMQARIDSGDWKQTGTNSPEVGQIEAEELTKAINYRERLFREVIRINERIDTLESASAGKEAENALDLWANELDLTGGSLEIKDKDGKVITTLTITGNDLERWLMDADVKKKDADAAPKPISMLPREEPGRFA